MKLKFSLLFLLPILLTACEKQVKVLSAQEAQKVYDKMSDSEIRTKFKQMTFNQCQAALTQMSSNIPKQVNKNNVCECVSNSTIPNADIKVLRLALLPAEALSPSQKQLINQELGNKITQSFPQCINQ